ncbi:MAG: hypothetical protein EBT80_00465 [Chitinophagales bacterium]|jgi:hypothetical protein|nr:hypothetical protein [Chitinophagales bacterium]
MSDKDIQAWENEFHANYELGLDQAIIQDVGEFVIHMIGGMKLADVKTLGSWVSEIQSSDIPDRYIRDIHHWFLVHTGVILAEELDPDDRRRLDILIDRCKLIAERRRGR